MKEHCHLCGATLRRPDDMQRIRRADTGDEIVVCKDVARCDRRIAAAPFGATRAARDGGAAVVRR